MIKTVYTTQPELIAAICTLLKCEIELDPTYSTGKFYTHRSKPPLRFDIRPAVDGVQKADVRALPLSDNSVGLTMFDPPFLATTGPSLHHIDSSNRMVKRFDCYENEESLFQMYREALIELWRVTKPGGYLIFKCQDKVSSGKQYWSHCLIWEMARQQGWYAKDLFILVAKTRMTPKWQLQNQQHARKFHCYFWVFQKSLRAKNIPNI